ncbi:MAG: DUF378 domain-containing protein [Clostridiales bacterium]|nr:DUF378 domain-containing protein [Clostridiales bacterium]
MKVINCIALALVAIGAINWGLVGFFSFDLVKYLFGELTVVSRIIYDLIGISGLYSLCFFNRVTRDL